MAQELTDIISKSSKQSLIDAQKNAENLNKTLQDTIIYAKQANDNLSGSKGLEDFNKKAELARQAQERTAKAIANTQLAEEKLNTVRLKNEAIRSANEKKAIADDEKRIASIKKKTATIISSSKEEVKAALAANNSEKDWIAISNRGNIERNKSAVAAAAISKQTKIVNQAIAEQIVSVDVAEKTTSRYSSRFTKGLSSVFSALRNIAYVLPGVGLAGLIGFAVEPIVNLISKLDLFKNKLSQAVENLKAFNEVNYNFAKIAGQEINTLKLLYNAATDVTLSIKDRTAAAKELQKQFPEAFKNSEIQAILNGQEKTSYDDLTKSILAAAKAKAVKDKLDELEARKLEIAIQKNKINNATQNEVNRQSDAIIKGINEQNRLYTDAQAKFRTTQGQTNKLIDDNVIKPALQRNRDAIKIQDEQEKIINGEIDFLTKYAGLANLAKAAGTKDPKDKSTEADARRSAAGLIQVQIEAQQKIADIYRKQADNPDFSLEARLDAQEKFDEASIKIAELSGKKELAIKKNTAGEIKAINAGVETDKGKVVTDSLKFQDKLYRDALKREVATFKEGTATLEQQLKQRVSDRIEASNIELENVENTRVELSNKAGKDYANGLIKREEYQRRLNQIDRDAARRALEIQIAANDAVIAIQQEDLTNFGIGDQKSINENLRKNTALKIRLSKLGTDATIEDIEREKKAREELNGAIQKLSFDAFNLGKQLIGQLFDARIEDNQKQIDALDVRTKTEIENVNESVLSEKEKADKIAIIEANAANKRQQLEARQRAIKIQQARADRVFMVGEAIANTALAVIKALPNLVLAGIIGTIGAVQIASIIAAPMPKFAKGGKMKADGLAEYGHGTEIRIDPDGKASLTSSTPEIGFVKKDTQFISAPDTKRLLAKPQLKEYEGKSWDVDRLINEQKNSTKELKKAILTDKKRQYNNLATRDSNDLRAYYKRNGF